jgi:hypothetical protein
VFKLPKEKRDIDIVLKPHVYGCEALQIEGSVLCRQYFEVKVKSSIKFHTQQQSNIQTTEISSYNKSQQDALNLNFILV